MDEVKNGLLLFKVQREDKTFKCYAMINILQPVKYKQLILTACDVSFILPWPLVDASMNAVVGRGYTWSFSVPLFAFRAILSVVFVTRVEAVTQNAGEFAQVQARNQRAKLLYRSGGVLLVQKSLLTISHTLRLVFLQREQQVNTFTKTKHDSVIQMQLNANEL